MSQITAIYGRVSSRRQDTASRERDLKAWAEGQKDEPLKWYRDKFTGKTMDRPGFQKLLGDVAAGKVARIVVWRLDRLSLSSYPRDRENATEGHPARRAGSLARLEYRTNLT